MYNKLNPNLNMSLSTIPDIFVVEIFEISAYFDHLTMTIS
jgi:hypothetical protein